jgi:hypothetical protein
MPNHIPHIKYRSKDPSNRHFGIIEIEGNIVHRVEDLNAFYEAFGYIADMRKQGVLPEEFIWEEYVRDSVENHTACYQIHIVEYLIKHSDTFRKKYGAQCENWIVAHAEDITARGVLCVTCRKQPFCAVQQMIRDAKLNA